MILLNDRISVPSNRKLTDAGQMLVPCAFARTGSQLYTAGQLGLQDKEPNEVVEVFRDEADVFDEAALESFRSSPVTLGHPKDESGKAISLNIDNAKELQVGVLEGMPVRDEDLLTGTLVLTAKEAIDALEEGTQELSAGYMCDIEEVEGKLYQRNIRANHIAIVAKGRAGSSCRISDEAIEVADEEVLEKAGIKPNNDELEGGDPISFTADEMDAVNVKLADAEAKVTSSLQLVDELKQSLADSEAQIETLKVEVADAKEAAGQDVKARCKAMEYARLISDMRDLHDQTVEQIERMVVEDQMPNKDLEGKSDAYISAMFEILVDASQGETPMGKLLKAQNLNDSVHVKPKVDKVAEARKAAIARNKTK